jgi:hypothetical protein
MTRGFLVRAWRVFVGAGAMGVLGAGMLLSSGAAAQPRSGQAASELEVVGTVLAIQDENAVASEDRDLVVDLGAVRGGSEGLLVELWRPLKLKHPVTGKLIVDRYRIGMAKLGQVRPTLALASAVGTLTREPVAGDLVIHRRVRAEVSPVAPPSPPSPPLSPAPSVSEPRALSAAELEAQEVSELFDSLVGAAPVARILKYEAYVRAKPTGRFSRVLYEEAASLRKLLKKEEVQRARAAEEPVPEPVSFEPPSEAMEGVPLRIAIEVTDVATGAVIHVRQAGRQAYVSMPMVATGRGFFSVSLPPERLVAPRVEYFIEATAPGGKAYPVAGTGGNPRVVDVRDAALAKPVGDLSTSLVLMTDFADFNRLKGNDYVWQTEGYLGVRYGDLGVRALRSGFGVYRGRGGSIEELDRAESPLEGREVGLTYGYLETEVGIYPSFSLIGRLAIGLLDDGVTGGGQVFMRIGSDLGTNLLLGGEILGGVGLRTIAQLELNVFERVPMMIRAETTNQPAGSRASLDDEGVATGESERGTRTILQVGYRIVPALAVAVRGSVQGRTINHAGPGFGGGLSLRW